PFRDRMEPWPLECSVFFSNLSYDTTAGYLRRFFSKVGEVQYVELYETSRGTSIGAGVVTFLTPEGASRAVTELDGTEVDGRPILVKPNERHSRKGGGKGLREACIFWDGVPYSTNEGFLRRSFERFGDIIDFDFWRRKDGRSHGMGTCTYSRVAEAEAAIESLNGSTIDGRSILVRKDEKRPGPGPKPAEEEEVLRPARSRGKGNEDEPGDGTKVFWSGVPIGTTEGFLRSQFERVGTIVDFDFWRNQDGSSLGKGTCRFDHFRGAQRALQRLHGYSIDGGIMMLKEDEGGNKGQSQDARSALLWPRVRAKAKARESSGESRRSKASPAGLSEPFQPPRIRHVHLDRIAERDKKPTWSALAGFECKCLVCRMECGSSAGHLAEPLRAFAAAARQAVEAIGGPDECVWREENLSDLSVPAMRKGQMSQM
ncbi:HRB1, partial [Symbiodinium sp. KB8]